MDLTKPYDVVLTGAEGDVLRVMVGSSRPFTGREVARLAGRAHTTAQRVLDRLSEHGLVDREAAGRAWLYSLNREHLAVPAVEALIGLRSALLEHLRAEIAGWDPVPVHASLFGSAARADGDVDSDIDLLVVRPERVGFEDVRWRAQLDDLETDVRRWTGNRAAILELSESASQMMGQEPRPPIVDELRTDAVKLAGADIRTVLPLR